MHRDGPFLAPCSVAESFAMHLRGSQLRRRSKATVAGESFGASYRPRVAEALAPRFAVALQRQGGTSGYTLARRSVSTRRREGEAGACPSEAFFWQAGRKNLLIFRVKGSHYTCLVVATPIVPACTLACYSTSAHRPRSPDFYRGKGRDSHPHFICGYKILFC